MTALAWVKTNNINMKKQKNSKSVIRKNDDRF